MARHFIARQWSGESRTSAAFEQHAMTVLLMRAHMHTHAHEHTHAHARTLPAASIRNIPPKSSMPKVTMPLFWVPGFCRHVVAFCVASMISLSMTPDSRRMSILPRQEPFTACVDRCGSFRGNSCDGSFLIGAGKTWEGYAFVSFHYFMRLTS